MSCSMLQVVRVRPCTQGTSFSRPLRRCCTEFCAAGNIVIHDAYGPRIRWRMRVPRILTVDLAHRNLQ